MDTFFRPRATMKETNQIPGIEYRAAIAALEDAGFWVLRDAVHVVMTNGTRILTIPRNDPVHAITMDGIVRDAGLTPEQFRQLL
jgi:predicted RNA binding protein YcfA (HicA-like mRNA interferase family)